MCYRVRDFSARKETQKRAEPYVTSEAPKSPSDATPSPVLERWLGKLGKRKPAKDLQEA